MAITALLFLPPDLRLSREFSVAAEAVDRIRARIEAETQGVPDGGAVLIKNVPQLMNRPYYFGWALQSALKKPFTESDLANNVLVVNVRNMAVNLYTFKIPMHFNRVVVIDEPIPPTRPYDFQYPSAE